MLCLANHADDTGGSCYPSIRTMARRLCCSEAQARRQVHFLIDEGYVSVVPGTERGGRGSRRYLINLGRLTPPANASPITAARGNTSASPPLASSTPDPSHPCDPNHHRTTKEASGQSRDQFDSFWQAYPRKVAKGDAEKAWRKIKPNELLTELILKAIDRANKSQDWMKDSGKFIPYPATWLNGKRWEDEPYVATAEPRRLAI
jgi:hypothetical protein